MVGETSGRSVGAKLWMKLSKLPGREPATLSVILWGLLVVTPGCSESNLAQVSGRVVVDGQPLTVGRVQFAPKAKPGSNNPGKPAHGKLQEDGSFVLGIEREDDGAIIGEHRVTLYSKSKKLNGSSIPPFDTLRLIDRQFVVQPKTKNEFVIELTRDYVKQFGEIDD